MMQVLHYATFASVAASERPKSGGVHTIQFVPVKLRFDRAAVSKRDIEMKICVLGAGVIGLTTAWRLAEAGHDVIVVDRNVTTGADASAANGGQLSYAFVAPLASPALLMKLPSLLMSKGSPIRIRPGLDPALVAWGARFLLACRSNAVQETIGAQLALAALSRSELAQLSEALGLAFGLKTAGKLVVFRTGKEFDAARGAIAKMGTGDDQQQVLTPAECLALEPGLKLDQRELAGGIYTASEQVGDCAAFCAALTARMKQRSNIEWLLGAPVVGPVRSGGQLVAVETTKGRVQADRFVLCMGAASRGFARACGFYLPIYPVKGYSITLTPPDDTHALRHSVTDMERKLVFAPLTSGERTTIRVAGIADLRVTMPGSMSGVSTRCAKLQPSCSVSTLPATSSPGAGFAR